MNITVYQNFVKRRNSTLQPTSGGTPKTVTLKEGTSIENPTFLLNGSDFTFNYVSAFNHYYFVDDVVAVRNGLTEIKCSMDPLATHKTAIGNYTAFIERSASFYDSDYPDPLVSMQNDVVHKESFASTSGLFISGGIGGCFVISVLNNKGSGTGFTTSYIISYTEIERLAEYVNTDWGSAASGVTTVIEWLQATFLKTADCIIDCIWLPIDSNMYSSSSLLSYEQIKIGVDNVTVGGTAVNGYRFLSPMIVGNSFDVVIPHEYSDFRHYAPYTTAVLFIPGYGTVDINTLDFKKNNTIKLAFRVDLATGDTIAFAGNYDGKLVSVYKYNIAVSCPVGKVSSNVTQTITGVLQTAGMIANARVLPERFQLGAELSAAASGVNSLASAIGITPSVSGAKGGRVIFRDANIWIETFSKVTSDPADLLAEHGRVLMDTKQLSTCSGYVKCSNASVPIDGMAAEKDEVNNYLNNGFYFE